MNGHGGNGHYVSENVGVLRECIRQFVFKREYLCSNRNSKK